MSDLRSALERLRDSSPGIFDVHYVDEVKRVAQWALNALDAAEKIAIDNEGRHGEPLYLHPAAPAPMTDDEIAGRASSLDSVRRLPPMLDEDHWPAVERALLDVARLFAAHPAAPAPDAEAFANQHVETFVEQYNDVYCDQRKAGVGGGDAERAAMRQVLILALGAFCPAAPAPDTCRLCGGTGKTTAVDRINADGSVVNPRPAVCMACGGSGKDAPAPLEHAPGYCLYCKQYTIAEPLHTASATDDLIEAVKDYMAAFGQALDAYGIPYGDQQREADTKLRSALKDQP